MAKLLVHTKVPLFFFGNITQSYHILYINKKIDQKLIFWAWIYDRWEESHLQVSSNLHLLWENVQDRRPRCLCRCWYHVWCQHIHQHGSCPSATLHFHVPRAHACGAAGSVSLWHEAMVHAVRWSSSLWSVFSLCYNCGTRTMGFSCIWVILVGTMVVGKLRLLEQTISLLSLFWDKTIRMMWLGWACVEDG